MADIVVMPSRSEGLPAILLESLSCGRPILASKAATLSGGVINGWNGFLINVSADEIAKKILLLAANRELLKKMSLNSQKLFLKDFTDKSNTLSSILLKL
jgi:glycosyltransferase involved in cell wall biosynthesis